MRRERRGVVVQIQGVPTIETADGSDVMIPGPLALQLDDAMLAILDAIERAEREAVSIHAAG
jgi:hypothetical protein